ncbi:MAG: DMT family transporter [Thermomicrobiales bacterium]
MKSISPNWAAPLALLGAVSMWGLTPTSTRYLVDASFSPEHILLWRFVGGGILSAAIVGVFRPRFPSRRDMPLALGLGLFGVLGFNVPLAFGINIIEGGIAALLLGMQPGFTALMAALFLGESVSRRMIAGLAVALTGTTLVAFAGSTGLTLSGRYLFGCGLVLAAALAYASYTVTAKPHLGEKLPGPAVAMIGTTAALPFVAPFGADGFGAAMGSLGFEGWLAAILLAAGASVFAPILFNVGLSLGRATNAGIYLYLVPVFGAVSSVILLGESLSAFAIVGGLLVIAGVMIATFPRNLLVRFVPGVTTRSSAEG